MGVLFTDGVLGAKVVPLDKLFDTNGDGTGDTNAVGDYAAASQDFKITTPVGQVNYLSRFTLHLFDSGNIDAGFYGSGIVLTNGIQFVVKNSVGDVVHDLLDGLTITQNTGWGHICERLNATEFGSGDNHMAARWHMYKNMGYYLRLPEGFSLAVTLNDDFTGLNGQHFIAQGFAADL